MKSDLNVPAARGARGKSFGLGWVVAIGSLVVVMIAILLPRTSLPSAESGQLTNGVPAVAGSSALTLERAPRAGVVSGGKTHTARTAKEVVAEKLAKFARSRRLLAERLGRRHGIEMSEDVKKFFDAVESGDWDEIQARMKVINGGESNAGQAKRPPGVSELWPAILDAYGAAEQVHLWPPQQLLDYGNSVLGALGPGMVYVGGTDNGRWVPELLNDTSDGEQHIVVTQNGLADNSYLDYVAEQYGGRLATLTEADSQNAFQTYLADAQQRLEHDQQFPNEPKELLPGEDVTEVDGHVQVSGQVAVMQINQALLQALLQKNPDLTFAMEESFPFGAMYSGALPMGPLMELNAQSDQNAFTPDLAEQSLNYWQSAAENVLADPDAAGSEEALRSYSHDAAAAANLLAANGFADEAGQAYQVASQFWPGNPEAAGGLANLLENTGHADEASQLLANFGQSYPDQQSAATAKRFAQPLWVAPAPGH